MRFSIQDFIQIKNWLEQNGVDDTQFSLAGIPLRGDESIVLTQNGRNVQMPLMDFITEISILSGNVDVEFIRQTVRDLLQNDPELVLNAVLDVMVNQIEWDADAVATDVTGTSTAEVDLKIEDL